MVKGFGFRIAGLGVIAWCMTVFYSSGSSTLPQDAGKVKVQKQKEESREYCVATFNGVFEDEITAEQAQSFDTVMWDSRVAKCKGGRIISYSFAHGGCAPFVVTVAGSGITSEIRERLKQARPKDVVIISEVVYWDGKQSRVGGGRTYRIKFPPKRPIKK